MVFGEEYLMGLEERNRYKNISSDTSKDTSVPYVPYVPLLGDTHDVTSSYGRNKFESDLYFFE